MVNVNYYLKQNSLKLILIIRIKITIRVTIEITMKCAHYNYNLFFTIMLQNNETKLNS